MTDGESDTEREKRKMSDECWLEQYSKVKNSRQGRLIVLARGCTTILSLSLLLSSLSLLSPEFSVIAVTPALSSPSGVWKHYGSIYCPSLTG